jgi:hemolysin activation/secretion protein
LPLIFAGDLSFFKTRTYLPKQKTSQGILKLTIIEGKINKLSSNNKNLYLNNLFSDKSES